MPAINVRELIHELQRQSDSPRCQCGLEKPRGVVLCEACDGDRYIETKQPSAQVACERLDQWEERT